MAVFQKATKKKVKLRVALIGPSGSGKSYTSLKVARRLAGPNGRIAVIDTEHGSASKYSDEFDFDVVELTTYNPDTFVEMIQEAEKAGYDVLIIDSLSHAWMGEGGMLDQVDKISVRKQYSSSFNAWRDVSPIEKRLWHAMLSAKLHLIATLRTKTEYVLEQTTDRSGKTRTVPKKVGLAPIQRDNLEYEFDVVAMLDSDQNLSVTKTRIKTLNEYVTKHAGDEFADKMLEWADSGEHVEVSPAPKPEPKPEIDLAENRRLFRELCDVAGGETQAKASLAARGYTRLSKTPAQALRDLIAELRMPAQEDPEPENDDAAALEESALRNEIRALVAKKGLPPNALEEVIKAMGEEGVTELYHCDILQLAAIKAAIEAYEPGKRARSTEPEG